MIDPINKVLYKLSKSKKDNRDSNTGYCIILRSRRNANSYWVYTWALYNLNPDSIPASFQVPSENHITFSKQTLSSIHKKYQSGLWEPILISRIFLSDTIIPYDYIPTFTPQTILNKIGEDERNYSIVGIQLYHLQRQRERQLIKDITSSNIYANCVIRNFAHKVPMLLHQKKQWRINAELSRLPPKFNHVFPGGIEYQDALSDFQSIQNDFAPIET